MSPVPVGSGEALILLGSAVVIVAWLWFGVLFGSLWSFTLTVVAVPLAMFSTGLVEVQRRGLHRDARMQETLILATSIALGLVGIVGFLSLLRFGNVGVGTFLILGGCVVTGVGGVMAWRERGRPG